MTNKELYDRVLKGESLGDIALKHNTRYDVGEVSYSENNKYVIIDMHEDKLAVARHFSSQVSVWRFIETLAIYELIKRTLNNTPTNELPGEVLQSIKKARVVVPSNFGTSPDTVIFFRYSHDGVLEMHDTEYYDY